MRFLFSLIVMPLLYSCTTDDDRALKAVVDQANHMVDTCSQNAYQFLSQNERLASHASTRLRMDFYLSKCNAQNKAYVNFTSDSICKVLTSYYDEHGGDYEKMTAYYLLGCAYRDMNDGAQALESFSKALSYGQGHGSDEKYLLTLISIHSQTAEIFELQGIVGYAIKESKAAAQCALMAHDTLTAMHCYNHIADDYIVAGNYDKCMEINTHVMNYFMGKGDTVNAAITSGTHATALLYKKRYQEAKRYLDFYERHSGFFDKQGNIVKGKEVHYYDKGMYYLGVGQLDSAECLFRKEARDGQPALINRNAAYHGLSLAYEKRGIADSTAKYALACYRLNDSLFNSDNAGKYQQMQAMFDYNRHLQNSIVKTQEAAESRRRLYISMMVGILLLWLAVSLLQRRIKQQRQANARLQEAYFSTVRQYTQEKENLKMLMRQNNSANTARIAQKEQLIHDLERRCEAYRKEKSLRTIPSASIDIQNSAIYKHLVYICEKINSPATDADWADVYTMVDTYLPSFKQNILSKHSASEKEYKLCILARLGFKPYQMVNITGFSNSDISQTRRRLMAKLFHIQGSSSDFDLRIKEV